MYIRPAAGDRNLQMVNCDAVRFALYKPTTGQTWQRATLSPVVHSTRGHEERSKDTLLAL